MYKIWGHLIVWSDLVTDLRLSDGDLRLYLLLRMHAQEGTPAPVETLAQELGVSRSTIYRRLQKLHDLKLIDNQSNRILILGPEQYLQETKEAQ